MLNPSGEFQWPNFNPRCTWTLGSINTVDSPLSPKEVSSPVFREPIFHCSLLGGHHVFLSVAGFSAYLGLYLWPPFPSLSMRAEWNLQKCSVLLLGSSVLTLHASQQSTHPLFTPISTRHPPHQFTFTFSGGPWRHLSLHVFSGPAPLAPQSLKYICRGTPSFNFSLESIFYIPPPTWVSYGDLKIKSKCVPNWIHLPSSPWSQSLLNFLFLFFYFFSYSWHTKLY